MIKDKGSYDSRILDKKQRWTGKFDVLRLAWYIFLQGRNIVKLVRNRDPCGIKLLRYVESCVKSREIKRDLNVLCDVFPFIGER